MKRILFLVLCIIPALAAFAQGPVEIYANGHKYNSFVDYLESKNAVRKTGGHHAHDLSDITQHQLYVLSVENGMVDAFKDFYGNQGFSDFQNTLLISPEQLQDAIAQAVTRSKGPKLLIASPGKLRIMTLTATDNRK